MAPPELVQFHKFKEFGNGVYKITKILDKIKIELKIDSFVNLANYLEKLFENIVAQKDIEKL